MDLNHIRYMGRFDFSTEAPAFAWSASTICARFSGKNASVRLKSDQENYFLVLIDGKAVLNALRVTGEKEYLLASSLEEGVHEVSLVRQTEFYMGAVVFLGFTFEGGELLPLLPSPERRIEMIGDSITCGFGSEGERVDMEYDRKYDNAYFSYGVNAARLLEAEYHIIGYSGFGIIRDYEGNEKNTLPSRYDLVIPEKNNKWDFHQWIPQVVGINLGTNDFSLGYIPDRNRFTRAYLDFIVKIRANYPQAHILCIIGPILNGEALMLTREYVQHGVVEKSKQEGFKGISFLELEQQNTQDGYGISWHPSIKTHKKAGQRLCNEIKTIMKW